MEKLELVEDAGGRGGDVDLLDGDELGLLARVGCGIGMRGGGLERRRRPLPIVGVDVPVIDIVVVADVLGLVDSREGTWIGGQSRNCSVEAAGN